MMYREPEIRSVLIADGVVINVDDDVKFVYKKNKYIGKVICIVPNNFHLKHEKFVPLFGISTGSGDKYALSTEILEKL